MRDLTDVRLGVIGLGYVGLPLAVEFGKRFPVTGYDLNGARIAELRAGRDSSLEVEPAELQAATHLRCTDVEAELAECNVYIVTVPTPIDEFKSPDLRPVESASRTLGRV
ncbi:MAG: Vi polysaccharide biosynthesis UDP-N-acetylglucosamine C-6 dehydrogenase TviB, partial [Chromatiaceae bacterium]|nr:Vi polysaccharide biosynthesis UDP-N-acetylglucosamine C-6 dehydrogenase TviB [Chromatiaceae bacterium]